MSSRKSWIVSRPFEINVKSIGRMVEAIRALHKKPLDAELIIRDFGPEGEHAQAMIRLFYESKMKSNRAKTLYSDWHRVFQQVSAYSPNRTKGLEKIYNLGSNVDYQKLLFSIHTYYAFIMKLIAAEIVTLYGAGKFAQSYLENLTEADTLGKLETRLAEVEDGVLFEGLSFIRNFVDGDYFSWYLDEWNEAMHVEIKKLIRTLSDYEIATTDLEPERVRDLFKSLYQKLIPRAIRIRLGEYYTPDWLADLVLDTAGYTEGNFARQARAKGSTETPLDLRFLDPSCGSGTFLLLAIKRMKEYAEGNFIDPKIIADKITTNIIGFDLNPLAAIASRTNYLLALGDLIRELKRLKDRELPVYLADSIMVQQRSTLLGRNFILRTTVGEFAIPSSIMDKKILHRLLFLITEYISKDYSTEEFLARLKIDLSPLDESDTISLGKLYSMFQQLEKKGKNRIWTGILKNSFAPLFKGKFDFVIGNPPWISWDNLPESYRRTLEQVWGEVWSSYKLIDPGGAFKKDIAALFVAYCLTRYLNETGTLGFLIPFTLFKVQSGRGFRRFLANTTKIQTVHDVVSLKPFEGAVNRPAMLICSHGSTKFPLKVTSWSKKDGEAINFFATLDKVKRQTRRQDLVMEPIEGIGFPESPWMMVKDGAQKPLRKIIATSQFAAQEGINTRRANGILFLELIDKEEDLAYIQNMNEEGAVRVDRKQGRVETDLLYPLLRGEDVDRWNAQPSSYIIVPNNPISGEALDETKLKVNFPKAYEFLLKFKNELGKRTFYSKSLSDAGLPFYTLFQVNQITFSEYKVVSKEISGEISGKGDFAASVIGPSSVKSEHIMPKKIVIPDHKLMFVPCRSEDEAFFVAGILNSSPARLVVASYTIETSMSTHVLDYVRIPMYDKKDSIHKSIVRTSKQAHESCKNAAKLAKVQSSLDSDVAKLFDLSDNELKVIRQSLDALLD
jgi:type I restriction-modification system DNA methylase subunit